MIGCKFVHPAFYIRIIAEGVQFHMAILIESGIAFHQIPVLVFAGYR